MNTIEQDEINNLRYELLHATAEVAELRKENERFTALTQDQDKSIVRATAKIKRLTTALEEIKDLKADSGLPEHLHRLIQAMKTAAKSALSGTKETE